MLLLLYPRFPAHCLSWSPDLKLLCKTGHSAFLPLQPSCTVRSALPLSFFFPVEQKAASGLSPYCWDQHLHPGNNLSPQPWVQDTQHGRMDLLWRVTSPLAHQTGLRHRRAHSVEKGGNFFCIYFFWTGTAFGSEINFLFWTIHARLSGGQMEEELQWDDRTVLTARRWWNVCKHHSDSDANLSGCQKYCFR